MSDPSIPSQRRLEITRAADGRIVLASMGGGMPVLIRMTDAEASAAVTAIRAILRDGSRDGGQNVG